MTLRLSLALLILACSTASAEVLFEAFYRIEKDGIHVGYFIERVSRDARAGTKAITMYSRQKQDEGEIFESYRSVAKIGSGEPISSRHLSNNSGSHLEILATFKNRVAKVTNVVDRSRGKVVTSTPAPHLSSFLFLVADLPRLKRGQAYDYQTFAEERGETREGTLMVVDEKPVGTQRILQVVNDFLGQPLESFVTPAGEPLAARQPVSDVAVYWVPTKEDAVGLISYPTAEFTALFGDLPEGKKNPWYGTQIKASEFVKTFKHSQGSRSISSKPTPLLLRGL